MRNLIAAIDPGETGASITNHPALCAGQNAIKTALGCIEFSNTNTMASNVVFIGMGIGSGIALLLIVFASFQIMTSQGDPKKFEEAKGLLTAALSGIALIILSGFMLRLLGINVLGLFE